MRGVSANTTHWPLQQRSGNRVERLLIRVGECESRIKCRLRCLPQISKRKRENYEILENLAEPEVIRLVCRMRVLWSSALRRKAELPRQVCLSRQRDAAEEVGVGFVLAELL